jgi:aryl-alcohol dehydrogenase-like predicted oxidoreductase
VADVPSRRLGRDGPSLTRVGFGAWAIGGPWRYGWGTVDDEQSIAAIRHAIDSGVNWVDTAAAYGLGHSEKVVAKAIAPWKVGEDVYVFTKCGLRFIEGRDVQRDLRPESIRYECEQSLKRLGVESIDLYQFHWPDNRTGTQVEDSWGTMVELVDEGKVRWAGVSNLDMDLLDRCQSVRRVDSLQPPFNLLDRQAADELIPWCRKNEVGVIPYSPMASGLLTGTYDRERIENLPDDDWRRESEDFQEPKLTRNLEVIDGLRPIAESAGMSLATLAVSWVLSIPGVTGAIVGARTPEQVDGWLAALDASLSEGHLREIDSILQT